jgi:hypothetical protein
MKQTAVEWLIEQFKVPNSDSYISKTFQQAIEMEKQQIKDSYDAGYRDGNAIPGYDYFDDSESYYEKTYKK